MTRDHVAAADAISAPATSFCGITTKPIHVAHLQRGNSRHPVEILGGLLFSHIEDIVSVHAEQHTLGINTGSAEVKCWIMRTASSRSSKP